MARTEYNYQFGHHDAILDRKLDQHIVSKNNPHQVNKFQIGLSSVDNTSDLDKPISTATQEYMDSHLVNFGGIEQNLTTGETTFILYNNEFDSKGNRGIIGKYTFLVPGSEGTYARYDNTGNEIRVHYAVNLVETVDEETGDISLGLKNDLDEIIGDEIVIKQAKALSNVELVLNETACDLKFTFADGTDILCDLNGLLTEVKSMVLEETTKREEADKELKELIEALDEKVDNLKLIEFKKVDELPETGQSNIIYLVPHEHGSEDSYDEYVYVNDQWEKIGNTDISDKLEEIKDQIEAETIRAEKAESDLQDNIDSLNSAKQDKLTAGDNIKIENNVISTTGVDGKYVDDKIKAYVDDKLPEVKKEFEEDLKNLSDKIDAEAKDRSDADIELSENKQDKIDDLSTIREGAKLGETAVQPDDPRLSDSRPASDVKDWAKADTKPNYTYSEVGAAAEDHNHDTEYSKLDHNHDDEYSKLGHNHDDRYAAKEHTHPEYLTEESDPVFSASPASGIKQEDIDKWNSGITSVSWNDVQDKPETFTPSEHTHNQYLEESDLEGYATEQWVESKGYLTDQDISGKADKADTYTKTETETKISEYHDPSKQDKIDEEHKLSSDLIDGTIITEVPIESISVNGTNVPADENKNVNISVPTKTSDLQKDDVYTKSETETKISEYHDSTKQDIITVDNKLDYSLVGGTKPAFVDANPGESATVDLTTLKIDGIIYNIKGSGSSSSIAYTVIPDESRNITVDIEDCNAYTLTTGKPIERLTINLPTREEIKFGFISEVNFRNVIIKGDGYNEDKLPSSCILINAPATLPIKYVQYGTVTDQCLISLHSVISLLFYFDGIHLLCYVNEIVG